MSGSNVLRVVCIACFKVDKLEGPAPNQDVDAELKTKALQIFKSSCIDGVATITMDEAMSMVRDSLKSPLKDATPKKQVPAKSKDKANKSKMQLKIKEFDSMDRTNLTKAQVQSAIDRLFFRAMFPELPQEDWKAARQGFLDAFLQGCSFKQCADTAQQFIFDRPDTSEERDPRCEGKGPDAANTLPKEYCKFYWGPKGCTRGKNCLWVKDDATVAVDTRRKGEKKRQKASDSDLATPAKRQRVQEDPQAMNVGGSSASAKEFDRLFLRVERMLEIEQL